MKVAILLDRFGSVPTRLIAYWEHYVKHDQLIEWDLASIYFRKAEFAIDLTKHPPVIGPIEILEV